MISLKEVFVSQFLLIQVISAWDLLPHASSFAPSHLAAVTRPIRQAENEPYNGYLQANNNNGVPINGMLIGNSMPNNQIFNNGIPNNLVINNGLPNINNGLPNNVVLNGGLPNNFAFNNGLPNNAGIRNSLSNNLLINNGLPNNLATTSALPNNLGLNDILPNNFAINNLLPNNGSPNSLALNNGLPNGLIINNGLPNNPAANGMPNNMAINNGLANNFTPNRGPSNNLAFNNGLPNKSLFNSPALNNAGIAREFSANTKILPFNNIRNGLSDDNNVLALNGLQNLNNRAAGLIFYNVNNLPVAATLPNINNFQFSNFIPLSNGLPVSNLPTSNLLQPYYSTYNNLIPKLNNIQITGFGIGSNDLSNINEQNYLATSNIPNNFPVSNGFSNLNSPYGNRSQNNKNIPLFNTANINNLQASNQLPHLNNNNDPIYNSLTGNNNPISNINMNNYPTNFIAQNINNLPLNNLNNGLAIAGNNNNNIMPVNDKSLLNNPFSNGFEVANNFSPNEFAVNNVFNPLNLENNAGYINNGLLSARSMPVTQDSATNGFLRNNLQLGNLQMPGTSPYDFAASNVAANQNVAGDGFQVRTNEQADCQSSLSSNNFNLAQELVKNLQIEGFGNLPCINGMPVAGITETVTLLNNPCS